MYGLAHMGLLVIWLSLVRNVECQLLLVGYGSLLGRGVAWLVSRGSSLAGCGLFFGVV